MRITIADDDIHVRGLLRAALHDVDACAAGTIVEVGDGATLLRVLCEGACDLVVADVLMPGLSGIEVIAVARRLGIHTPFVVVTGLPENVLGDAAVQIGRTRLLRKPFTLRDLRTCVRELLADAPLEARGHGR